MAELKLPSLKEGWQPLRLVGWFLPRNADALVRTEYEARTNQAIMLGCLTVRKGGLPQRSAVGVLGS